MRVKYLDFPFQVKEISDEGKFTGYASVFGVLDSYREIVAKGAFKKTIEKYKSEGNMPPILWQHRSGEPIGVHTVLKEDDKGLYIEGDLVLEVEKAREARALMARKAVRGISIGFVPKEWTYNKDDDVLTLDEVELWENSIVTFPANPAAQVESVKSALIEGYLPDIRSIENALRDAGLSMKQAKTLLAKGYDSLVVRDEQQDLLGREVSPETLQSLINTLKGDSAI